MPPFSLQRFYPLCCCLLFIALGIIGITGGYNVYNHTYDEQAHLAAGMELLTLHRYDYETLHPPLARMMIALLPYLEGLSPPPEAYDTHGMWEMGTLILYKNNNYFHNLTLARMGILPFYILAVFTVFAWGRRFYDTTTALSASLLFATMPSILANSMVATTDMAMAATFTLALYVILTWLEQPSLGRSAALGLTAGLAMLTKTSTIILLPCAFLVILLYRGYTSSELPFMAKKAPIQRNNGEIYTLQQLALIIVSFILTIWCGHFFINFPSYGGFERFFAELQSLFMKNDQTHYEFFLGKTSDTPFYYPVIFFVKTPLGFTLLLLSGLIVLWKARKHSPWQHGIPLLITLLLLTFATLGHIHIGLRHVLAIYPLLSLVAGYGISAVWRSAQPIVLRTVPVLLVGWHVVSSAMAYPYYISYFNELITKPEAITIHSDLGWGGELHLLAQALEQRHIRLDYLYVMAYADPAYFGLPANLCPWTGPPAHTVETPRSGWYAIDMACLKITQAWLHNYTPVAKIGSSILLYYVP